MGSMTRFLLGLPFSHRQRKLAASRPHIEKTEFVARIVAQGGDERAAELVWDTLITNWATEGLTPYPDDSLGYIYGIAEEDLDEDLIVRILTRLGVSVPNLAFVKRYGVIDSPLRIAQFVSECRTQASWFPEESSSVT